MVHLQIVLHNILVHLLRNRRCSPGLLCTPASELFNQTLTSVSLRILPRTYTSTLTRMLWWAKIEKWPIVDSIWLLPITTPSYGLLIYRWLDYLTLFNRLVTDKFMFVNTNINNYSHFHNICKQLNLVNIYINVC